MEFGDWVGRIVFKEGKWHFLRQRVKESMTAKDWFKTDGFRPFSGEEAEQAGKAIEAVETPDFTPEMPFYLSEDVEKKAETWVSWANTHLDSKEVKEKVERWEAQEQEKAAKTIPYEAMDMKFAPDEIEIRVSFDREKLQENVREYLEKELPTPHGPNYEQIKLHYSPYLSKEYNDDYITFEFEGADWVEVENIEYGGEFGTNDIEILERDAEKIAKRFIAFEDD